jgi:hypothetical protein
MKNADKPAHPCTTEFEGVQGDTYKTYHSGLTKREIFAMAAMQSVIQIANGHPDYVAKKAVEHADALLAELEKTN